MPASACLMKPMICSVVNLLFFMSVLLGDGLYSFIWYGSAGAGHYDELHSTGEERFLMLGMSSGAHLLLVCHCERDGGGVIRIISARKATKQESSFYSQ